MRKKGLAMLLTLAMLLGMLPTAALAAGPDDEPVPQAEQTEQEQGAGTEVQSLFVDAAEYDLPGNDELFAEYVQRLLYPERGVALFGTTAREHLNANAQNIYDALKTKIEGVAAGNITATYFTLAPANFGTNQNWATVSANMQAATAALLLDCPYDLYWFDKTAEDNTPGGWQYTGTTSGNNVVQTATIYFYVAADYQNTSVPGSVTIGKDSVALKYFTTDTTKTQAASEVVTTVEGIVSANKSKSDYEKLKAYKDEICKLTSYNNEAAGDSYSGGYGDPWQLIYVFDNNPSTTVVCEGYSKAFQYLCDKSKFDNATCYTVTGTMTGGTGQAPTCGTSSNWKAQTIWST